MSIAIVNKLFALFCKFSYISIVYTELFDDDSVVRESETFMELLLQEFYSFHSSNKLKTDIKYIEDVIDECTNNTRRLIHEIQRA